MKGSFGHHLDMDMDFKKIGQMVAAEPPVIRPTTRRKDAGRPHPALPGRQFSG